MALKGVRQNILRIALLAVFALLVSRFACTLVSMLVVCWIKEANEMETAYC